MIDNSKKKKNINDTFTTIITALFYGDQPNALLTEFQLGRTVLLTPEYWHLNSALMV